MFDEVRAHVFETTEELEGSFYEYRAVCIVHRVSDGLYMKLGRLKTDECDKEVYQFCSAQGHRVMYNEAQGSGHGVIRYRTCVRQRFLLQEQI